MNAPEPVFEAPWHAQVFALTVHLNEAGHLAWGDWAERFGATLKQHGLDRELNGGEDYFAAWIQTLEGILGEIGMAASVAEEHRWPMTATMLLSAANLEATVPASLGAQRSSPQTSSTF